MYVFWQAVVNSHSNNNDPFWVTLAPVLNYYNTLTTQILAAASTRFLLQLKLQLQCYLPPTVTMPRVLSYTPPWLAHGTTGCAMFTPKSVEQQTGRPSSNSSSEATPQFKGARRSIAQRGTEVFVAVGNTIRWADLALLKDEWGAKHGKEKLRTSQMRNGAESTEQDEDPIESLGFKVWKVILAQTKSNITRTSKSPFTKRSASSFPPRTRTSWLS